MSNHSSNPTAPGSQTPELLFAANLEPADGSGEGDGPRRFSGIAYSGEAIVGHWAWGDVVFDLDSMTLPDRLPALVDHDRGQRAGVIDQFQIDAENGLTVSGYLLDNESGRSVAADADAGFPWQMSVHIEPRQIDEASDVTVNGHRFERQVTVFRQSSIREVSFTPTGADSQTAARVFHHQPNHEDHSMTTEELKQQLDTVTAERDAARTEATQFKTERDEARDALTQRIRTERKQQFAAVMGDEPSDEEMDAIAGMSDTQFSLLLKKPTAPTPDDKLFSEQATGGDTGAKNPLLEA